MTGRVNVSPSSHFWFLFYYTNDEVTLKKGVINGFLDTFGIQSVWSICIDLKFSEAISTSCGLKGDMVATWIP